MNKLTGNEPIHRGGTQTGVCVLDFWRWTSSDLLGNAVRGRLVEYLVAVDLGIADGVREEWVAYDLDAPGGIKVEVKSAAYVQTWHQDKPTDIQFQISPTLGWDPDTGQYGDERKRHADVYVFALLGEEDETEVDPSDVANWRFYVLPTRVLNSELGDQGTMVLNRLLSLEPEEVGFGEIKEAIERAAVQQD